MACNCLKCGKKLEGKEIKEVYMDCDYDEEETLEAIENEDLIYNILNYGLHSIDDEYISNAYVVEKALEQFTGKDIGFTPVLCPECYTMFNLGDNTGSIELISKCLGDPNELMFYWTGENDAIKSFKYMTEVSLMGRKCKDINELLEHTRFVSLTSRLDIEKTKDLIREHYKDFVGQDYK